MKEKTRISLLFMGLVLLGISINTYSQVVGEWTELDPIGYNPLERTGHSTIYRYPTNEIVILGGFCVWGGYRNDIHSYSIDSNEWTQLPDAPLGGYNASIYDPLNDRMMVYSYGTAHLIHEFDFGTNQWSQFSTGGVIPPPLDFPSAAYNSTTHCMMLHGGRWVGSNYTFSLDLNTLEWELLAVSGDLPLETKHQATIYDSINEVLIVFGGETWPPSEDHNETFVLDLNTNIWTKKDTSAPLPCPRTHIGYDYSYDLEKMIIMGGHSNIDPPNWRKNDTWLYDMQSDSWEKITIQGDLPPKRNGHSTIAIDHPEGNSVYIFGGAGPACNNDLWRLDYRYLSAETSIADVSTCPDTIAVPVYMKDLYNIIEFNLNFSFDTAKINFCGYQNLNSLFNFDSLTITYNAGTINMSWSSTDTVDIESDTLIDILFFADTVGEQYIANLVWDDSSSYYIDSTFDSITSIFSDGQITIDPLPVIGFITGADSACQGQGYLSYFINSMPIADSYFWSIIPDSAGELIGIDTFVTLYLSDDYYGNLILSVYGSNQCGDGAPSSLIINVTASPFSNAGIDDSFCEGDFYLLSGIAENYSNIFWTSSGDGYFDNPEILSPLYFPGSNDISLGFVKLTLTAYPNAPCPSEITDTIKLSIYRNPAKPLTPVGPVSIIIEPNLTTEYFTNSVSNTSWYQWHLNPGEAGLINAIDTSAAIQWNESFSGSIAYLNVEAVNNCGEVSSDSLVINISPVGLKEKNSSPEITIAPNPSSGVFNISINGIEDEIKLSVVNNQGNVILQQKLNSPNNQNTYKLDISNEPAGVYYLKFSNQNYSVSKKVIVNTHP